MNHNTKEMTKLSLFGKLGWLSATGVGLLMVTAGFSQKAEKVGVVDMNAAYAKSGLKTKNEDHLQAMTDARKAVLDFLGLNPSFTPEQLKSFRTLSLQEKLTEAEKKQLEDLKTAVQAATKESETLRQKPSPTPEEVKKLDDFGTRNSFSRQARQQLSEEFVQEMNSMRDSLDNAAFVSVREAVREIGKNQSFTVIYSERATVFGATDITEEVRKAADKKGGA